MAIALYGGTFDPIHHGHLILARDAIECLGVEQVVFIPAAISPHKLGGVAAPAEVRCEMVARAIAGEDCFVIDDQELRRAGPSYTIETVEAIRAANPGMELIYLIGEDNIPALATWHRIEELRGLVEFVVFGRGSRRPDHSFRRLERHLDLSSTEVRERVARGLSIRYLVAEPVCALIEQYRLYRPQNAPL